MQKAHLCAAMNQCVRSITHRAFRSREQDGASHDRCCIFDVTARYIARQTAIAMARQMRAICLTLNASFMVRQHTVKMTNHIWQF